MALGSSTLAKRFDSAFYIVEKRIVYITWMRNMIVTINSYAKSSQQYNYNLKVNMQLFQKFIDILGRHK